MTPDIALKILAGIALEYTTVQKDRPATQEALLLRIQDAHNALHAALNPLTSPLDKIDASHPD